MPLYESVFITRQDVPAQEVEALAERFGEILAEQGGKVAKREYWGLKNLAYRIKKNRKGHYTMFQIDAPPAAVLEMERNMRISEDVLRYLTVRIEAIDEEASVMMQSRAAREDRARRDDRRGRSGEPRARPERADEKPEGRPKEAAKAEAPADKPDGGEKDSADAGKPKGRAKAATEAEAPADKPKSRGKASAEAETANGEDA